jgi:electron transfer flavoprotein beta subunit
MAAKSKPVKTLTLADLGIAEDEVGLAAASTVVSAFSEAPPRSAGTVVKDEGSGGAAIADFLAGKKLI